MLENRYEEYVSFSNNLPFLFSPRLTRNREIHSHETNWHENIEIQLCNEGAGTVLLDGEAIPFGTGDAVVVNSNVIHHTGSSEQIVYSCLIIDQRFCADADIDPTTLKFKEIIHDSRVTDIFLEIERVYSSSGPARVARLRALALSLLVILREEYTQQQTLKGTPDVAHENVKKAINYIRLHYPEKISLDGLSKSIYADKYVLSRQFKRVLGQTVVEYINSYRVKQASVLLDEGRTVSEAARLCGFNNLSFFSRIFKKHTEMLPTEYKKKRSYHS